MGSSGVGNILTAIEKLEAGTVKERTEGLNDLRRRLGHGVVRPDDLEDEVVHQILETLFRTAKTEKQTYLRTSKPISKNTAASRLSTAASALRLVTEVAGHRLGQKTISALCDHIIDTLSATDTIFCPPVETDYLNCFNTILQYHPFVEHLRPKQWFVYVDFFLDAINRCLAEESDDAVSTQSGRGHGSFRETTSVAIRASQVSNNHGASSSTGFSMKTTLIILSKLTRVSNAPLIMRLTQLSETLTAYASSMSWAVESAFESINNLLPIALTEDLSLAAGIFKDICGPIQRQWGSKNAALRDQMIVSLFYLRHVYLHPISSDVKIDASLLDLLVDVIWSELEGRLEKELLQLDSVHLMAFNSPPAMSVCDISPTNDNERVTAPWATLYILSLLLVGLKNARDASEEPHQARDFRKRRRLEHSYDDIFWRIHNRTGPSRIVALQIAVFVAGYVDRLTTSLVESITKLDVLINEDDAVICSWTMLLLSSHLSFDNLTSVEHHQFWRNVWAAAARASTNSSCTRFACYLMQKMVTTGLARVLMPAQAISSSIFSDGSSGPAVLTDAALLLLTTTLNYGLFDSQRATKHFAGRSLNWLEARWTIPTVPDLLHNFQTAEYGQPILLSGLICAITGTEMSLQRPAPPIFSGAIYRAVAIDDRDLGFVKFMAPSDGDSRSARLESSQAIIPQRLLPDHAFLSTDAITEFLILKLRSFRSTWLLLTSERIANINKDIAEVAATACALSTMICAEADQPDPGLQSISMELWTAIGSSCSRRSPAEFEEFTAKISSRLLQLQSSDELFRWKLSFARKPLVLSIIERMKHGPESQDVAMLDFEFGDSFDERLSQTSQARLMKSSSEDERHDLPQSFDHRALFLANLLYLKFDSLIPESSGIVDADMMSKFLADFLQLDEKSKFGTRSVIQRILEEDISVKRSDVSELVKAIGELCLQRSNLERCEAALCLCLRVLTRFVELWAGPEEDNLANSAYDIYEWYLNVALAKSIASERVLQGMATMLERVLTVNPTYANGDLPSPRTILLQILQKSPAGLKFQLAPQLSKLFEGYVLSEHTAIFDDVVDKLPSDPDDKEGIEARLYILAYLGARWHTVLREALYHIFETVANVPTVSLFAKKCVLMVCEYLQIQDVRSVFRLFSSQIFYTWLEKKENLATIPAQSFGYQDVGALLRDNQDEIVAQVVMRASSTHANEVTRCLGLPWKDLVSNSFAKVIAYTVIADVTNHRTSRGTGEAEKFLLSVLSDSEYSMLLSRHIAQALSIILLRLADDRGFEKAVDGGAAERNSIAASFDAMCKFSSSETQLPPGQQPSFRVKYLISILKKLSYRMGLELDQLWPASVLTSAFRSLLDDTNKALGPLHACATMRKLRVLISMSEPAIGEGYNLEMLLHGIRPYTTVFHCSADAIGIMWFLLEHGKMYLQSRLQFVTGLGVTMFASLSRFVSSTQDSTTQESHFRTTMSHAEQFRKWLDRYLTSFQSTNLDASSMAVFGDIIQCASQLTQQGTNSRSTSEGSLLHHLLIDQATAKSLLPKTSFQYTLEVLCRDFSIKADPADDILAAEDDLIKVTPVLWKILQGGNASGSFKLWIGESIGRSCLIVGPEDVSSPQFTEYQEQSYRSLQLQSLDSYSQIITALIDHLWGSNSEFASVAERTLQLIFSSIAVDRKGLYLNSHGSEQLFEQLRFRDFTCPDLFDAGRKGIFTQSHHERTKDTWATDLARYLCQEFPEDPVLKNLSNVVVSIPSLSSVILPSIVHLALISQTSSQVNIKDHISQEFSQAMSSEAVSAMSHTKLILNIIVYLRRCAMPSEVSMGQRNSWLPINFEKAAFAAFRCNEYHTALLMLEINASQHALNVGRTSKRSSAGISVIPQDLLIDIYRNIGDPDFFYGTTQDADFTSIVGKLCHEGDGKKALSFQSAIFDANVRHSSLDDASRMSSAATVTALNMANFRALASIVGAASKSGSNSMGMTGSLRRSTLNLEQWSFGQTDTSASEDSAMTSVFNSLISAPHLEKMLTETDSAILSVTEHLSRYSSHTVHNVGLCSTLAVLAEIRQSLTMKNLEGLPQVLRQRLHGRPWVERVRFDSIENILLARETFVLAVKNNASLRTGLKMSLSSALLLEVQILRSSLSIGRAHDMPQFSLNRAAYMSGLIAPADAIGLKVDVAIQYDTANTFWSQDETAASINILQGLQLRRDLTDQAILINKSEILTDLGQKLTQARLDRADEITSQYLRPAIEALGKDIDGSKAGKVYHNFAVFCDEQLRDPDNLDEYYRVERLRNRKKQEVEELEILKKSKEGKERDQLRGHLSKAQTWFKLDELEWRRLKKHREGLVSNCLENYLRSMRSCDDFPNDVLRFLALWLEQSENSDANATVEKYVPLVQSYKFAPLMNQLSSRILDAQNAFQKTLFELMFRICNDHPYHSLYQVFATSKSKGQKNDTVATSRHKAASRLAETIMRKGSASSRLISIHNIGIAVVRLAQDKLSDRDLRSGSKVQLRKLAMGAKLEQAVQDAHRKIPPPTAKIALRPNRDYSSVPVWSSLEPYITIAGGISAPKIVTAIASDGVLHKMLLKGGNDDLRQDSIMEQVFEQVSNLLQDHRATRQRDLGIRTYKVIPLTHNAGIIEFVRNTIPLHDFILPAHARYYPKDYGHQKCRKEIADVQTKSIAQRLQVYHTVTTNFHPVMRFFFMEHFLDPDEWFRKRLNYSRSTATISILGHVLGLGDRHGHNILLDKDTGEVIHIDLGVAFEAGRVLPVPEVVPFRLTRDIVDGMGISGVEGVFRRCCNFTLEALRQDQEAIMTILDVLRWDPLYSWSVSPIRLQRMQENQEQAAATSTTDASAATTAITPISVSMSVGGNEVLKNVAPKADTSTSTAAPGPVPPLVKQNNINEPGEADRALAVVARKLGKSLSVEATVNDLIRQAMDERNLAVLYCGWAAYA